MAPDVQSSAITGTTAEVATVARTRPNFGEARDRLHWAEFFGINRFARYAGWDQARVVVSRMTLAAEEGSRADGNLRALSETPRAARKVALRLRLSAALSASKVVRWRRPLS